VSPPGAAALREVAFGSAFQSPTRRWGLWNFLLGDESESERVNERMSHRSIGGEGARTSARS
jgi:hypothetical protein